MMKKMHEFFLGRFRNSIQIAFTMSLALMFLGTCGKKITDSSIGVCTFSLGQVFMESSSGKKPLNAQDPIAVDAIITTGNGSAAVLTLHKGNALVEIQANAKVNLTALASKSEIFLEQGNIWTQVRKITNNDKFLLRTPTSIAAVRGTKFFTFSIDDIKGICFCEGKVEHTLLKGNKSLVNADDYLMIYRGNKSAIVTADELRKGGCVPNHDHSSLDLSPLGKKNVKTQEQLKKFVQILNSKLL